MQSTRPAISNLRDNNGASNAIGTISSSTGWTPLTSFFFYNV